MPAPGKKYHVTPEQFVRVWESATSLAEASAALGMPEPIASARASQYRKMGVNLKSFPRGAAKVSVAELNKLIKEVSGREAAPPPPSPVEQVAGKTEEDLDAEREVKKRKNRDLLASLLAKPK